MARTISQQREAFGGIQEMDAVALKLIASVGVDAAYRSARPVLDLANREVIHTSRPAGRKAESTQSTPRQLTLNLK
jgi:hypothetical protein